MASLLYGLAGKLVGELCSPVFQDYVGKPWEFGTNVEFEKLSNSISAIEAVLLDAEEQQKTNRQVQDWLKKIKLVFHDLEDLLQDVTTEALKRQVMTKDKRGKDVRIFFSSSNQVRYRLKMGHKVKLIRERLDAIASDRNRFNLTERLEEIHVIRSKRREETHSFVPLEKFIGRDEDKSCVSKHLMECDAVENVSVISIVGMGGLGKTTLAQSIYSSEEVNDNFELMMWVCVSDVFDVKLICEKIIESATKNKCKRLQMDGVKDELRKAIDGRKYLLVLDDVWNENPVEWLKLEELLTSGAAGSKILITARSNLVARAAKSIATHFLKGLCHEESWALFKQAAFKRGIESRSSTIVGIGKEVVEICSGVPLVIKTIGSMLSLRENEIDWLNFRRIDLPLILQDGEGKVVSILKLSYDYLLTPLKRCFAYCAVFPKDYEIEKETLIRMWIAQGLIQLDGTTRCLEDIAEQHLKDLLNMSLFEVYDKYDDSSNHLYKMHDLIHDLAQSVGGNDYFNLGMNVDCIDKTTRHAWVHRHIPTNLVNAKKLRTLIVRDSCDVLGGQSGEEIMNVFKKIRVLDLTGLRLTLVPRFVDGLRYLKYLDLSKSTFDLLPESVCSLYNLQTLILIWCKNLKKLPVGTRNLVSLRHLDITACGMLRYMPLGMEELTCLHTLTHFFVGAEGENCSELGELKSLVNLRGELRIRNLRVPKVVKCKTSNRSCYIGPLTQLKFIEHLALDWCGEDGVDEEAKLLLFESLKPHSSLKKLSITRYGGNRFPSWMDTVRIGVSLPNIVYIYLYSCKSWQHLSPFGLLPSLEELSLWNMDDIEYIYEEEEGKECWWNNSDIASTGGGGNGSYCTPKAHDQLFPSLRVLHLRDMPNLTGLVGPTAASRLNNKRRFPVLETLHLSSYMETLPSWLQFLSHLQTLELICCENMVFLPEWMGNLTSLKEIRLRYCESLASIPDCIRRLSLLQRLMVERCSKLYRRCEKETGEDWLNIAHIPNISVK